MVDAVVSLFYMNLYRIKRSFYRKYLVVVYESLMLFCCILIIQWSRRFVLLEAGEVVFAVGLNLYFTFHQLLYAWDTAYSQL